MHKLRGSSNYLYNVTSFRVQNDKTFKTHVCQHQNCRDCYFLDFLMQSLTKLWCREISWYVSQIFYNRFSPSKCGEWQSSVLIALSFLRSLCSSHVHPIYLPIQGFQLLQWWWWVECILSQPLSKLMVLWFFFFKTYSFYLLHNCNLWNKNWWSSTREPLNKSLWCQKLSRCLNI